MNRYETVAAQYIQTWNETDAGARRALVEKYWTAEATYTDPLAELAGADAISAAIGAVQGQFAGLVFSLGGVVDGHHDLVRFTWHLGPAGEEPIVVGFDVVELDGERIKAVHGFLDKVPAGA
ncbi:nuclear transport factor 2 family protein [Phytomonospora sp. NPDC050363]|uniref:nuclear transport factor 2 family protein n=1 Tax=Phytomonospora sp. NPDC050363 TaxID=3155642 RepID=UPI0033CBA94C